MALTNGKSVTQRMPGTVALVTGGGHGIGRATVRRFRAEGAKVLAADLDLKAVDAVAEDDDDVQAAHLDVLDQSSVDACVALCLERFGQLDHLVCTVGGDTARPAFADLSDEDWLSTYQLNQLSVVRCIRAALPHLSAGSSVTIVGSVNGLAAWGSEPYAAAKAGLSNLAANLASSYGPQGIRFNVVAPGTIRTRVWDNQTDPDRFVPVYPLGRIGEPEDVANAIAFLASSDADWVTGITLPVDGGAGTGPAHLNRQVL